MIVDPKKYNQLIDAVEIDKTILFPYRSFEKINKSGRT
jgi:hypothetical protein